MNKCIISFLLVFISAIILIPTIYAGTLSDSIVTMEYDITTDYNRVNDDFDTNCQDFAHTIRIGGYLLLLVRVLLPIVIIVKATMSLVSVITNGKPEELQKKVRQLVISLIAGVIIFFIPIVVDVIFGFINGYDSGITEDSKICTACIFEPYGSICSTYAD